MLTLLLLKKQLLIYYASRWKAEVGSESVGGGKEMGVSDTHFICRLRSIWATCLLHSLPREPPDSLPGENWALALACHCAA